MILYHHQNQCCGYEKRASEKRLWPLLALSIRLNAVKDLQTPLPPLSKPSPLWLYPPKLIRKSS